MSDKKEKLTKEQKEILLGTLKERFEQNMDRHKGLKWEKVHTRLKENAAALLSLYKMEESGGEPDVVLTAKDSADFPFFDCVQESPGGRRSLCYDEEALASRKKNKPSGSAMGMAADMGVELMTEEQYRLLQQFGDFDTKTSSWLQTPETIRSHGGAIFGDFRYAQVFIYHNGAESYYAARGFRAVLKV